MADTWHRITYAELTQRMGGEQSLPVYRFEPERNKLLSFFPDTVYTDAQIEQWAVRTLRAHPAIVIQVELVTDYPAEKVVR